jgi:hypothetical protein
MHLLCAVEYELFIFVSQLSTYLMLDWWVVMNAGLLRVLWHLVTKLPNSVAYRGGVWEVQTPSSRNSEVLLQS